MRCTVQSAGPQLPAAWQERRMRATPYRSTIHVGRFMRSLPSWKFVAVKMGD